MELIVKRGLVDNGEKVHGYGEQVTVLDVAEAKRLIKSGMCEPALSAFSVSEQVQAVSDLRLPDSENPQGDQNQVQDDLTPEQFEEVKADEQKRILTEIGIDPASKEEDRITQYTEWYNTPITE